MGIWSDFIYTYTPNVMINFSKLPDYTIEWLNGKIDFNYENYTKETANKTILELGNSFCDCAKIWGYLDKETVKCIRGLLDGLTESANMVFKCDADYVSYYVINFDKLKNEMSILLTDEYNELSNEEMIEKMKNSEIKWIDIKDSKYEKDRQKSLRELLLRFPNANMDMISLGMTMNGFN
jgi:hypothetical protein